MYLILTERQLGTWFDNSIFKFKEGEQYVMAIRLCFQDDGVSKHVREAIRREKLERQFKQHQVDIVGDIRRDARAYTSKVNFYNFGHVVVVDLPITLLQIY